MYMQGALWQILNLLNLRQYCKTTLDRISISEKHVREKKKILALVI